MRLQDRTQGICMGEILCRRGRSSPKMLQLPGPRHAGMRWFFKSANTPPRAGLRRSPRPTEQPEACWRDAHGLAAFGRRWDAVSQRHSSPIALQRRPLHLPSRIHSAFDAKLAACTLEPLLSSRKRCTAAAYWYHAESPSDSVMLSGTSSRYIRTWSPSRLALRQLKALLAPRPEGRRSEGNVLCSVKTRRCCKTESGGGALA